MNKAYAYKNTDEILQKSSSGGAFIGIVNSFIKNTENDKWVVYGAEFDDSFDVVHNRATTLEECYAFCGSKYTQSDISNCFEKIFDDLIAGYKVLFTGTPCQVAAVKKYIDTKDCCNNNLFTVDIACHGAPQKNIWKDFVKYLEVKENSKLVEFSFRYKKRGWKGYPVLARFENGTTYENDFATSGYMTMFRKNLLMPERCFSCKFAGNFKSDITIADFWGVEICMPEVPVKGGVSVMIAHSEKGEELMYLMHCNDIFIKEAPNNDYIKYNPNIEKPTAKPELYEKFWSDYQSKGFEHVLSIYGENNLKGKVKFYIKRFLRDSGLLSLIKKVLKKA